MTDDTQACSLLALAHALDSPRHVLAAKLSAKQLTLELECLHACSASLSTPLEMLHSSNSMKAAKR